jgi:hypothetical protein
MVFTIAISLTKDIPCEICLAFGVLIFPEINFQLMICNVDFSAICIHLLIVEFQINFFQLF